MILSPRKRKPYMVNLRQQRLLLSFVVAFRRCHPSGMLMRLARMLVLLAQTPPHCCRGRRQGAVRDPGGTEVASAPRCLLPVTAMLVRRLGLSVVGPPIFL